MEHGSVCMHLWRLVEMTCLQTILLHYREPLDEMLLSLQGRRFWELVIRTFIHAAPGTIVAGWCLFSD